MITTKRYSIMEAQFVKQEERKMYRLHFIDMVKPEVLRGLQEP